MSKGIQIPQLDPTTVEIPPAGYVALCSDLSGVLNVIQPDGTIIPINPINQMSAQVAGSSSAGAQTVGPGSGDHTVLASISGLASVRQFCLSKVGLGPVQKGWRIMIVFLCPNTVAGIALQIFDANTSGQMLFDYTTDGLQQSAVAICHFDGAQWQLDLAKVPASL